MAITPDVMRLIDEIRDDRTHGAGELARRAASVFKAAAGGSQADDAPQFLSEMSEVGQELMSARPSMAPIRNTVSRLLALISERAIARDVGSLHQFTIVRVDEIISESLQAAAQIILHAQEVIADGDRIMTHSYSSTVVALLKEASSHYKSIGVIITRSGAGRTGEQIVREMADCELSITFVDDTAVGLYIPTVTKVLLGADAVCAGGVVNGVGSYQLVVMAARYQVPVYILADTMKFDANLGGEEVDIEDRDGVELIDPAGLSQAVSIRNPHFDITPLELITRVVTERGVMAPADVIASLSEQSVI
ncbi:MAG TPA: translation initiation factor eIF-2B [Dehalococcoidia bacterium]|nr:translation initiation factor eIF-2B [Dehalococcoidia bacterium]